MLSKTIQIKDKPTNAAARNKGHKMPPSHIARHVATPNARGTRTAKVNELNVFPAVSKVTFKALKFAKIKRAKPEGLIGLKVTLNIHQTRQELAQNRQNLEMKVQVDQTKISTAYLQIFQPSEKSLGAGE